jgi:predicted MFS family arabinose efflux permease
MNGLFALLSAFAPDYTTLVMTRMLAGVGVGGSIPIVFSNFAEFLPTPRCVGSLTLARAAMCQRARCGTCHS